MTRHRRLARALGAVALGLMVALTGCGTDSGADAAPELSATEHNYADVAFASDLIQRHAVSLSLVDLTLGRDLDPEVQRLVEELRATQSMQVETMAGWLLRWGEPIPETVRDHSNAGHGDDGADPGMAGSDTRAALEGLPASEFQDAWLRAMVDHHEGTVARARTHQDEGRFEPAVELGEQVISQESNRVETMEELLDG